MKKLLLALLLIACLLLSVVSCGDPDANGGGSKDLTQNTSAPANGETGTGENHSSETDEKGHLITGEDTGGENYGKLHPMT